MHPLPEQVRAIVVAAHIKTIGGGSTKISSKCTRPPLGGSGSRDYVGICAFLLGPPSQFAQLQVVAPYNAMLLWLGDIVCSPVSHPCAPQTTFQPPFHVTIQSFKVLLPPLSDLHLIYQHLAIVIVDAAHTVLRYSSIDSSPKSL